MEKIQFNDLSNNLTTWYTSNEFNKVYSVIIYDKEKDRFYRTGVVGALNSKTPKYGLSLIYSGRDPNNPSKKVGDKLMYQISIDDNCLRFAERISPPKPEDIYYDVILPQKKSKLEKEFLNYFERRKTIFKKANRIES